MDEIPAQGPRPAPELSIEGPLTRAAARAILDRAAELLDGADFRDAALHYRRVVGYDDPVVTAAALLGLGEALFRLDQDDAAIATWESILELPETPSTYPAWRNIAAARVREGDLGGAIAAYREADRRAPLEDKPEIANRLGWLAKETGDARASRRYFARGRGGGPAFPLSWIVIGLTVIVSMTAFSAPDDAGFVPLMLDKLAVANGEYWRLWTVTLVHGSLPHLFFNMYALYLSGPLVETLYGSRLFALFYLLCAAAGSIASFVFGGNTPAVGASGAIFGLFGLLLAASRAHHPVIDRRGRALMGQVGVLIAINLVIGGVIPGIDNAAHVGGLLAGIWLGLLIVPGRVPTLSSLWVRPTAGQAPGNQPGERSMLLPTLGVAALIVVLVVGVVLGTSARRLPGSGGTADLSAAGTVSAAAAVSAVSAVGQPIEPAGTAGRTTPTRAPRGTRFSA
jgi:membrane associated rhomboid family serine protease